MLLVRINREKYLSERGGLVKTHKGLTKQHKDLFSYPAGTCRFVSTVIFVPLCHYTLPKIYVCVYFLCSGLT